MRLIAAALFAALMFATPAAAQRKCELGTQKKPLFESGVYQIAGPAGPIGGFRDAQVLTACDGSGLRGRGLTDANGKVLVPPKYHKVIPLTPTLAAVRRLVLTSSVTQQWNEPFRFYEFGKGEKEVVPWKEGVGHFEWEGVRYPYGSALTRAGGDILLLQGDPAHPVPIRNLGGRGWDESASKIEQIGGSLLVHFTASDGAPVSRLLDLRGSPLTPVLGGIEKWDSVKLVQRVAGGSPSSESVAADYVSVSLVGDHPAMPYGKLYVPITPAGDPLPMPAGVIGVFPLQKSLKVHGYREALGWGFVEETPQGVRIRWGLGPLQALMAQHASLPAVTGMRRHTREMTASNAYIEDVYTIRGIDGQWRVHGSQDMKLHPLDSPGSVAGHDAEAAYTAYVANRIAFRNNVYAEYQRERAAERAKWEAYNEALHKTVMAGDFCNWYRPGVADSAAPKTLNHILANCPNIQTDAFFNFARSLGADPELLAKAEHKYWSDRGRYAIPIPPADPNTFTRPNWAAWGNAMIQSARDSTDNFIRDRKRQYYENLERWNTGKQKSCC